MGLPHETALEFENLTFKTGLNVTVRDGEKWLGSTGLYDAVDKTRKVVGKQAQIRIVGTLGDCFCHLESNSYILPFISNPEHRTYSKLFQAMRRYYPGRPWFTDEPDFKQTNDVTVIYFIVTKWGKADKQVEESDAL